MKKLPILAALLCSTLGHAGYRFRYQVTVAHTQAGASDSANFPILVYISSNADFKTAANGGYIQNTVTLNGQTVPADLIVATNAGCTTQVTAWEVAGYSATAGNLELWVNQGTLSHTVDTVFYICIDNASVSTYQSTATSTWDGNFKGVWHLPDGTTLAVAESTVNANSGTNHGATAVAGVIDGGAKFVAASSQYVSIADSASLDGTGSSTLEAWLNPVSVSVIYGFVTKSSDSPGSHWGQRLYTNADGKWWASVVTTSPSAAQYNAEGGSLSAGSWAHVVNVFDSSAKTVSLYVNGTFITSTSTGTILRTGNASLIGASTATTQFLNGNVDEVRLSNVARSADWITAEYNMEKSSQTMVTLGSRVALGGPRGAQVVELQRGVSTKGLH